MTTRLLTTKLHIPRVRPEFIPRPRLIERLDEHLDRKLTLVSASAGFGKTTLLSGWASRCGRPVAWLSLDEGDNDPGRFIAYFIAALLTIGESIGRETLGALRSAQQPTLEDLLTVLINQISAIPNDLVLVLDDYHLIQAQPIHKALAFLLDHLPTQMHLVIATRSDPPLPLARLRGRGQLTELRQTDLRFTLDEVAQFLNQVIGLDLAPDDVRALASRTEGWIAGLQLAAVSMQGRDDLAGFIRAFTGSNRYVLDYLVEEVLERQPPSVQTFLLQTAILGRLSGPLCDAVVRISEMQPEVTPDQQVYEPLTHSFADSQAVLEHLDRANLFVVPLDDRRQWYRYHRLFADLLGQRLQQTLPDQVSTLHRRASEWYEQNGLKAEAIHHALSAEDFERAARLVSEHAETLWGEGAQTTLLRWLEALPDEQVASHPQLCIFHAMALSMSGQHQAAELRLQAAERALGSITDGAEVEQLGQVAAVRALIAYFQGDVPAIIQFSDQALELIPKEKTLWRSSAAMNLGDAHRWNGDMAAADQAYEQAAAVGQATGNTYLLLTARTKQALIQMNRGRLQRAIDICRQQLQLLDEGGLSQTPMAGGLLATLAGILYERNDLEEALHYAQRACELSERGSSIGLLGLSLLVLLRTLIAKGHTGAVKATAQKLDNLAQESDVPIWIASGIAARQAETFVEQEYLDKAARLLQERGVNVDDDLPYPRLSEHLALARLLTAQGRFEEAAALLERLLQTSEAGGQVGWMIAILIRYALASQAQGDTDRAGTALERALSLAEPEGYVRVFVDEGEPVAQLLRQAADRGVAANYAKRLLATLEREAQDEGRKVQLLPPPLIEPLSEREREVLRLLNTQLSSTGIAEELIISVNTVRSHIRSIYGKLDVHSRYQALARAKELGLL